MKRIICISIILLFSLNTFAQKSKTENRPPPPPRNDKKERQNHNCAKNRNESLEVRLKNFPFSKYSEIKLVSFQPQKDKYGDMIMSNYGVPIANDTICYSRLEEVKTLSHSQIDTLTDIFYNYGFRGKISLMWESLCFIPRNAILFLDSNEKVIAYISICFECEVIRTSSEQIDFDLCEQKVSMIKNFFKKTGIEYGITKGVLSKTD